MMDVGCFSASREGDVSRSGLNRLRRTLGSTPFPMAHAAPITLTEFDPHEARMEKVFIGIAGLIGAGKSTLAKALSERVRSRATV